MLAYPTFSRADIFVWRDTQGVKHYTNSRKLVPQDVESSLLIEEPPQTQATAAEVAPAPAPEPAPEPVAVAYDPEALAAAFQDGWQRGMAFSQESRAPAPAPVNVNIQGPFVASTNQNTGGGGFDPWWPSYFYPSLVTTSFDGGRSRHLTLRMLMQDQFAFDREGPYFVVGRFPPVGPNLATFLPRGLPMVGRPPARVINH
jgi:hypothetical protein